MKGSYIYSATNITDENNRIQCELLASDGQWVENSIMYVPDLEYHNVEGRFTWDTMNPGISPNDNSLSSLILRYPQVSARDCLINYKSSDIFDIQNSVINAKKKKCICISLFKANPNNTQTVKLPVDQNMWNEKYLDRLIHNLDNIPDSLNEYEINLYMDPELRHMYKLYFSDYKFLNVYIMKNNSIGACPGSMYRFLKLFDKHYDVVVCADIDESWDWIEMYEKMSNKNRHVITTPKSADIFIDENEVSINYPTVNASRIITRPKLLNGDYDMKKLMIGFINYCQIKQNESLYVSDYPITWYNHPIPNQPHGWGSRYPMFGFDEYFLKHVIVYLCDYNQIKFIPDPSF